MIRVLLVDDQTAVRAGFRALLERSDDIEVVGEAGDGEAGVALAQETRPDVVLMDIRMPVLDGIEATRRIAADPSLDGVKVVVLTTFEVDDYVFDALRNGASGFLGKDVEPDELRQAVRVVAAGQALLSPSVTRRVVDAFADRMPPSPSSSDHRHRIDLLTEREREVIALVGGGLSNEEIGRELIMSPLTAKTHVSRAMTKLGARDRVQLVVIAYESGLVAPGR